MIKRILFNYMALTIFATLPFAVNAGTMDEVVCPASRSADHTDSLAKEKKYLNDVLSSSVFQVMGTDEEDDVTVTEGVGTATLIHIDSDKTATFITAAHIFDGYDTYSLRMAKDRDTTAIESLDDSEIIRHSEFKTETDDAEPEEIEGYKNFYDIALIKVKDFSLMIPPIPLNFKFDDIDVDGNLHLMGYRSGDSFSMLVSNIATKQNSGLQYSSAHIYDGQSGGLLVSDFGVGYGVQSGYEGDVNTTSGVFQKIKIVPLHETIKFIMERAFLKDYNSEMQSIKGLLLNKILVDCPSGDDCINKVGLWAVNNLIRNSWQDAQVLSYLIMSDVDRVLKKMKKVGSGVEAEELVDFFKNGYLEIGESLDNRKIIHQMISCTLNKTEAARHSGFSELWELYHIKANVNRAETVASINPPNQMASARAVDPIDELNNNSSIFSSFIEANSGNKKKLSAIDVLINRRKAHLAKTLRRNVQKRQADNAQGIVMRNPKKTESMKNLSEKLDPKPKSPDPKTKDYDEILKESCKRIHDGFNKGFREIIDAYSTGQKKWYPGSFDYLIRSLQGSLSREERNDVLSQFTGTMRNRLSTGIINCAVDRREEIYKKEWQTHLKNLDPKKPNDLQLMVQTSCHRINIKYQQAMEDFKKKYKVRNRESGLAFREFDEKLAKELYSSEVVKNGIVYKRIEQCLSYPRKRHKATYQKMPEAPE